MTGPMEEFDNVRLFVSRISRTERICHRRRAMAPWPIGFCMRMMARAKLMSRKQKWVP